MVAIHALIFKCNQLDQLTMTTLKAGRYWLEQIKDWRFYLPILKRNS